MSPFSVVAEWGIINEANKTHLLTMDAKENRPS
jgi:hypothetical protein